MVRRRFARACAAVLAAVAGAATFVATTTHADAAPGQVVFDSLNLPNENVISDGYLFYSSAHYLGIGPLFQPGSGFEATSDADISGLTVLASSTCQGSCPDVQFYFVEKNATGDGVIPAQPDPTAPGYVRVPNSLMPRSPSPDPNGSYLAPVTLAFPVPLHVATGHSYYLIVQDADVTYGGALISLGRVVSPRPAAGEIAATRSFAAPSTWLFQQCGYCVAMQLFNGTPPPVAQPIRVSVNGGQIYGASPAFVPAGTAPTGVTAVGSVSCPRVWRQSPTIDPSLSVGSYSLDMTSCGGLSLTGPNASKYRILYTGGSFRVDPAPLTVTPADASRPYGLADPAFTYSVTGFVNGETASVVSGQPTLYSSATAASPPGTYYIAATQGTFSAPNYYFRSGYGTLTVVRATPVITLGNMRISAASSAHRVQFTATVHNTATFGPPAVGVPVTFSAHSGLGRNIACTATTDANGVATCASKDWLGFAFVSPRTYTATIPSNQQNFTGATAKGTITS